MRVAIARSIVAVLLATACVAPSTAAQSARKTFAFRGAHLGDTAVVADTNPFSDHCTEGDVPGLRSCMSLNESIGGESVSLYYQYLDGRLFRFTILYKPASFDRLAELFAAQYGAPASRRASVFRTVGGSTDANLTLAWQFRDGAFVAKRYASALDDGQASIVYAPLARELALRQQRIVREQAKRDMETPRPTSP